MKKKIAVIFGTRPDTIKLAPIILRLKSERALFDVVPIATAQHRHMLDQVLEVFRIVPKYDLNIMRPRQSLALITKKTIEALDHILVHERPDMVLVQGDTLSTFVGSLAAFFRHIPVGHVEAGLRTHDKNQPFPEEINRRLTGCIADLHFAPTNTARKALLRENVDPETVFVTGNSVIDALQLALQKGLRVRIPALKEIFRPDRRVILVTMHRRENWGEPMRAAAEALKDLVVLFPDVHVVFPVHRNPIVREAVNPVLGTLPRVHLIEPLDYLDFVFAMAHAHLIITDSGGVQEEGPALGKPILVLREKTERPEAVAFGTVKLVGVNRQRVFSATKTLLVNSKAYDAMATAVNPYGDGRASERIVGIIKQYFGLSRRTVNAFSPRKGRRS